MFQNEGVNHVSIDLKNDIHASNKNDTFFFNITTGKMFLRTDGKTVCSVNDLCALKPTVVLDLSVTHVSSFIVSFLATKLRFFAID